MSRLVILGDVHAPYTDPDALNFALQYIRRTKPTAVLQIGDAYEQDSTSAWAPAAEREPASAEFKRGREMLAAMWAAVGRYVPKARRLQLPGNHDQRAAKRAWDASPGLAYFVEKGVRDLLTFDGVELHDVEELDLGEFGGRRWSAVHGHSSRPGSHATHYATNIVCGHLHKGYVVGVPGGYLELNAGWLGANDHHSKFYARARRQNWQHGVGVIDDDGPRFVPFNGGAK